MAEHPCCHASIYETDWDHAPGCRVGQIEKMSKGELTASLFQAESKVSILEKKLKNLALLVVALQEGRDGCLYCRESNDFHQFNCPYIMAKEALS